MQRVLAFGTLGGVGRGRSTHSAPTRLTEDSRTMDTPIAAVLWPDHARRDMAALMRLMAHLERCCLEIGAEEAAGHLAQAAASLALDGVQRKMAA